LFSKNLSNQSIRIYKDLCSGVGISFQAIPAGQKRFNYSSKRADSVIVSTGKEISFSAQINQLQKDNNRLVYATEDMRRKIMTEIESRKRLERELQCLKEVNQKIQEESRDNSCVAIRLKEVVRNQFQGLAAAVQELQALQDGLPD
jgi:predicted RNase H-like nuclease (RuvC/YqgF family)